MPNSNNINFSASHDQAGILAEMALKHKELGKITPKLENLGDLPSNFKKLLPEELQQLSEELKKQYNELDETKKEIINFVTHARQIVSDLQECAKKHSTIHLHTPDEKLKHAKSLLATHKSLTANEKYRFKKIEEALSNTCIIKSAGDETIKFQLGTLGYAKDSDMITESEFNYLVEPRLKDNNLLDFYRLRAEKDMIVERTPLEICQAINEEFFSDDDYKASKDLIKARIKGIDFELSLHNCNNELPRDVTQLQEELMSGVLAHGGTNTSTQNFEGHSEGELLLLPEVPADSVELNSQQPSNETPININHTEENKKKSEFVSLMQEFIPEKKKNVIHLDTTQPMSLEKIMQHSLERSITLSETEIFHVNYKNISDIQESSTKALQKMHERLKKSNPGDGSYIYQEMESSCDTSKKNRAENLKKPEPCKLTDEPLVKEYYEFGKKYLNKKIQNYKTAIKTLEENKIKKWGEFSKYNSKYDNLSDAERKKTLNIIYDHKKTTFNRELENAEKQQALWLGKETFIKSIEKKGKIKQEEIPFPEVELRFRNLVLNFDSNSASEGKTINVYQDGVFLVTNKKNENEQSGIQISSARASYKYGIQGQTASSFNLFSIPSVSNEKKENRKLPPVNMFFGS